MSDNLQQELEKLERSVADFEAAEKTSIGFVKKVQYRGISFNVSTYFVVPDLAPLAFFQLVEHNTDGVDKAIVRLYDRVSALLTCVHSWVDLKRVSDEQICKLLGTSQKSGSTVHVCRWCTAYAVDKPLPVQGRSAGSK